MEPAKLQRIKTAISKKISQGRKFAIIISEPDGDSVGSGLALWEILTSLGKKVDLLSHFTLDQFSYLPHYKKFRCIDLCTYNFTPYDALLILDATTLQRIVDKDCQYNFDEFINKHFIINIDHHHHNSLFGDIDCVVTQISSTAELLYDIFLTKGKITPTIATNLLNGFIADTVCFRQTDVTFPKTLRLAAELMDAGADHRLITHNLYYNFDQKLVESNIKTLATLKVQKSGPYVYAYTITDRSDIKDTYPAGEKFVIANEVSRSIQLCNFSLRLTRLGKGKPQLSLISRDTEVI